MSYLPKDVTNPFTSSNELLPPYDKIPDEFKQWNNPNKWNRLFNDMFFKGLTNLELIPKEGIDPQKAFNHIKIAMGGWDSKHEHKEAGCAYLFSLWFEDVKWKAKG